MTRSCIIKNQIMASMVTTESIAILADWCGGSIKGIKLPLREQEIEFWCKHRGDEIRAKIGDYIVQLAPGVYDVYPLEMFHLIFSDIDDIPY